MSPAPDVELVSVHLLQRKRKEVLGFKTLSKSVIPVVRSRSINFTASGLRPFTRVYAFFDGKDINAHITPDSNSTTDATPVDGSPLIVQSNSQVSGTFVIPDPKIAGNLRFQTGDVQFKLTNSSTNASKGITTFAATNYIAKGILNVDQETVRATRNGRLAREGVTEIQGTERPIVHTAEGGDDWSDDDGDGTLIQNYIPLVGASRNEDNNDPTVDGLSQIDEGRMVTSVDLFFSAKDDALPIFVEIRNVIGGMPGPKVLPFSRTVVLPANVNTSTDGKTATKITFSAPSIFLQSGQGILHSCIHHICKISYCGIF
jgi:hypothetical protein